MNKLAIALLTIITIIVTSWLLATPGQRYQNPEGSLSRKNVSVFDFIGFFYRLAVTPPEIILPKDHSIKPDEVLNGLGSQKNRVTWMGHSSFIIKLGNTTILTDPFLTDRASPVSFAGPKRYVPAALTPEQLPKINMIVISHDHYDHLDLKTLEKIPNKEGIEVIVPTGVGPLLRSIGYTNIHELGWHKEYQSKELLITALPALHFSGRGLFDHNKTLWASYAIESKDLAIYFSCDTGYGPIYKTINKKFDYALLPIGAYQPENIMRPMHINPEEAIKLAQDINAKTLIPMHWGTIVLTEEPISEPIERLRLNAQQNGAVKILPLRIGETKEINQQK